MLLSATAPVINPRHGCRRVRDATSPARCQATGATAVSVRICVPRETRVLAFIMESSSRSRALVSHALATGRHRVGLQAKIR